MEIYNEQTSVSLLSMTELSSRGSSLAYNIRYRLFKTLCFQLGPRMPKVDEELPPR